MVIPNNSEHSDYPSIAPVGLSEIVMTMVSLCLLLAPTDRLRADPPSNAEWQKHLMVARHAARGGDRAGAETAFREAESLARRFGSGDPRLAQTLNNFGVFYLRIKEYRPAEAILLNALKLYGQADEASDDDVASLHGNLGTLYFSIDKLGKARSHFEQALEIQKEILDRYDPKIAETVLPLAAIEQMNGRSYEAERLYRRVLNIYKKSKLERSSSYSQALQLVTAMYYKELGRLKARFDSSSAYRKVVLIDRLSSLHADYGDGVKGENVALLSLKIRADWMGQNSPAVTRSLGYLATALRKQKRYEEARESLQRALAITESVRNLDPTAKLWILRDLARVSEDRGDPHETEGLFKQILSIEEKALGPGHPNLIARLQAAADAMDRLGSQSAREGFLTVAAHARHEQTVFRVGEETGVSPPLLEKVVQPSYSGEASSVAYEATVVLRLDVMPDGTPDNIHVYRCAGHGLDRKAKQAVRQWRFTPAKKDGEPVAATSTVEVNFRMSDN